MPTEDVSMLDPDELAAEFGLNVRRMGLPGREPEWQLGLKPGGVGSYGLDGAVAYYPHTRRYHGPGGTIVPEDKVRALLAIWVTDPRIHPDDLNSKSGITEPVQAAAERDSAGVGDD